MLKYAERNLESIRKNSQDFKLHTKEEVELDSEQKSILVEYSDWSNLGNKRIHFYDLYVIDREENKSYSVQIIFDKDSSEEYKEFLKNDVLKTFTLPTKSSEE